MTRVDIILENVNYFNSSFKKFILADISILNGRFYYIRPLNKKGRLRDILVCDKIIDLENKYLIPGLIDIHMHIESSMLTPFPFTEYVKQLGITTLVAEPHEMANVKGIEGLELMIKEGEASDIDIFYGIPSCVPSTNPELETTGAIIDYDAMMKLSKNKSIACLGEVMNYRGVIKENNNLDVVKFIKDIKKEKPAYVVEGHCPSLIDEELARFIYLGIDSDHTEHNLEELIQRYEMGMFVEIQAKMLHNDILSFIISENLYEQTAFVTDDVMVDDLYNKGQLNYILRKAVEKGFPLEMAIYCATKTPALRMNFRDRGEIKSGYLADFSIHEKIEEFKPEMVFKNGRLLVKRKDFKTNFKKEYYHSLKLSSIKEEDLLIHCPKKDKIRCRIMNIIDGTTQVKESFMDLNIKDGILYWQEEKELLLACVFDRYNGINKAFGLIRGDTIKQGACATTWFHDHHNLFVMGRDIPSMINIANEIIKLGGGIGFSKNGKLSSILPLPVAGILSEKSVEDSAKSLEKVRNDLIENGYKHYNPIMSMGTLGLVVSPYLKLSDKGLVDIKAAKIVDLFVEDDEILK